MAFFLNRSMLFSTFLAVVSFAYSMHWFFDMENLLLIRLNFLTSLCAGNEKYAYAKRLDPGQWPSNFEASLISNLFATQPVILHKKTSTFSRF